MMYNDSRVKGGENGTEGKEEEGGGGGTRVGIALIISPLRRK